MRFGCTALRILLFFDDIFPSMGDCRTVQVPIKLVKTPDLPNFAYVFEYLPTFYFPHSCYEIPASILFGDRSLSFNIIILFGFAVGTFRVTHSEDPSKQWKYSKPQCLEVRIHHRIKLQELLANYIISESRTVASGSRVIFHIRC